MTRHTRTTDDDARAIARDATTHSFLNCYIRETGAGRFRSVSDPDAATDTVWSHRLDEQGIDLTVPVAYRSPTGRHCFDLPGTYASDGESQPLDYLTLVTLLTKELEVERGAVDRTDLVARVIQSCQNVERYVEQRRGDDALTAPTPGFRDAEQSLVFGHHTHPTPKSRSGLDDPTFEPECDGAFQLHYFAVDPALVEQGSAREDAATAWIRQALAADPDVPQSLLDEHADDALVPLHPWQAEHVIEQPHVASLLADGRIESLGRLGREFAPTASIRTLYAPDAPFMVKGSLAVAVTNSERTNKLPELERGVAIAELLDTELGDRLADRFPAFDVIRDPAYLTVDAGAGESGFEVVLRENVFPDGGDRSLPVVALCQDPIDGRSRLERLIEGIAEREGRSTATVSESWFRQYLDIGLRPLLWLYLDAGIGLEAHQQNSVLTLDEVGYPARYRYRDNQGYYFPEGAYERVDPLLPGVGERADTICPDAVADERIRYYVLLNNVFGVINAFGTAGLVDERRLLGTLRETLDGCREFDRPTSSLLDPLLNAETVPCKANLLTRLRGLDELDAPSLDEQSVYTEVANPLADVLEAKS